MGDEVRAKLGSKWCKASVTKVHDDASLDVAFESGEKAEKLAASRSKFIA